MVLDSKRHYEWNHVNVEFLITVKLAFIQNDKQNNDEYICSYPKWENLQGEPRDWGSPGWPYLYWNAKTSAGYRLPIATKILSVSMTTEEATCGGFLSMCFHSSIYQNSFTGKVTHAYFFVYMYYHIQTWQ